MHTNETISNEHNLACLTKNVPSVAQSGRRRHCSDLEHNNATISEGG